MIFDKQKISQVKLWRIRYEQEVYVYLVNQWYVYS